MGVYFKIVNPVKRQYIDIGHFADEDFTRSGVLSGYHAYAVALLACNLSEVRHNYGPLAGSWFGDPIIAAGDDSGAPDAYGVVTATAEDPRRNLNGFATQEFENITYPAIAMLCQGNYERACEFADRAKTSGYALVDLGRTVFEVGCPTLEAALNERIGVHWMRLYKQACAGTY
jgi:hypothetical protein